MVSSLINICVLLLVCLGWIEVHLGCIEEERIGLLKLKEALDQYPSTVLGSWDIEQETDCCKWEYVKCDPITNRVLQLYLNDTTHPPGNLNLSLFHPFQHLQDLDLSSNRIQGVHGILTLKKLQTLNLFDNRLTEIPSLGTLDSLKYLDLGWNRIWANCSNFQERMKLKNLESLNLEYNHVLTEFNCVTSTKLRTLILRFNDLREIPPLGTFHFLKHLDLGANNFNSSSNFQELMKLRALETLNLAFNRIFGQIPQSITNMTSLRALSLEHNLGLDGSWDEGLCRLKNLEELSLSDNQFSGVIPSCLNNLTSLKLLDLSGNFLVGTIPSTLFLNLKSLEYVSLSYNLFEGSFSFPSFGNNSKLEVFQLATPSINRLKVYTKNSNWTPQFQLKFLRISNCELDDTNFLVNQYDLRVIRLNDNRVVGKLPNWLLINNTNLEFLSLGENFFTGRFSLHSDTKYLDMTWLDISMNQIHGELPNFIGSVLPNLRFLNMSTNEFQGLIPPSVGDMTQLQVLDLSNNNLSGEIPELLVMGCTSLWLLKLSNNNLQGWLLPVKSNLSYLEYLFLDNNYFSGELLPGLLKSTGLQLLHMSNNTILGEIPYWLGNFSELGSLVLSRNSFEGHIPASFCRLQELILLDLSHNRFYGVIPSCFHPTYLSYLHLQGNNFIGPLPHNLTRSPLVTLDLRDNKFSGRVPDWISSLSQLRVLLLKENYFNGSIPFQICQLEDISILDMSVNNFSGMIPTCLRQISFGAKNPSLYDFDQEDFGDFGIEYNLKYSYSNKVGYNPEGFQPYILSGYVKEAIEFMSKRRFESYTGNPLDYMSGLDLSSNKLTGPIPNELGNLTYIHTLNLSHNQLYGLIPSTLSKLKQVQSLDLSYNMLCGQIPPELIELNFLSVFSVAYNNLSGRLPDWKSGQFGTFEEGSYEGNPLLCGQPIRKSCNSDSMGQSPSNANSGEDDSDSFKDAFLLSFLVSFAAAFSGVISLIYISVHYKRQPFAFIEAKLGVCQCILLKLFCITRT